MLKILLLIVFFSISALAGPDTIVITPRNSVIFDNDVEAGYTRLKIQEIEYKAKFLKPKEEMYLVLDTYGGLIYSGLDLISAVRKLNREVKTITINAQSMGFEIVQNLGERLIIENGKMMSHRKKWVAIDFEWPIEPGGQIEQFAKLVDAIDLVAATRMGLSLPVYQAKIMREYNVRGDQAVKDMAADRVVKVICGKTMKVCPQAFK